MISIMNPDLPSCADMRAESRIEALLAENWKAEEDYEVLAAASRATPIPLGDLIVSIPCLESQRVFVREVL